MVVLAGAILSAPADTEGLDSSRNSDLVSTALQAYSVPRDCLQALA